MEAQEIQEEFYIDSGFLRSSLLGHAQGTGLDFQAVRLSKPRYFGRMICILCRTNPEGTRILVLVLGSSAKQRMS